MSALRTPTRRTPARRHGLNMEGYSAGLLDGRRDAGTALPPFRLIRPLDKWHRSYNQGYAEGYNAQAGGVVAVQPNRGSEPNEQGSADYGGTHRGP